jgi:hypothetical protein
MGMKTVETTRDISSSLLFAFQQSHLQQQQQQQQQPIM